MKSSYLLHGLPGHPVHPPLTDATIGAYTFATVAGIASKAGFAEHGFARGWWLALLVGLISSAFTVTTGLLDWLTITRGSELWKTATTHALAMATATVFFVLALALGHKGYGPGTVPTGALILSIVGFVVMTAGGWLGGAITYVHGMRVLNLVNEPTARAVSPLPNDEKARAAKS
jgi:uncharacterized membrane protein